MSPVSPQSPAPGGVELWVSALHLRGLTEQQPAEDAGMLNTAFIWTESKKDSEHVR